MKPTQSYDPASAPNLGPPAALLIRSLVDERVEKTLALALADYRNKALTEQAAYACIAQIAALRGLATALDDRIKHHKE